VSAFFGAFWSDGAGAFAARAEPGDAVLALSPLDGDFAGASERGFVLSSVCVTDRDSESAVRLSGPVDRWGRAAVPAGVAGAAAAFLAVADDFSGPPDVAPAGSGSLGFWTGGSSDSKPSISSNVEPSESCADDAGAEMIADEEAALRAEVESPPSDENGVISGGATSTILPHLGQLRIWPMACSLRTFRRVWQVVQEIENGFTVSVSRGAGLAGGGPHRLARPRSASFRFCRPLEWAIPVDDSAVSQL